MGNKNTQKQAKKQLELSEQIPVVDLDTFFQVTGVKIEIPETKVKEWDHFFGRLYNEMVPNDATEEIKKKWEEIASHKQTRISSFYWVGKPDNVPFWAERAIKGTLTSSDKENILRYSIYSLNGLASELSFCHLVCDLDFLCCKLHPVGSCKACFRKIKEKEVPLKGSEDTCSSCHGSMLRTMWCIHCRGTGHQYPKCGNCTGGKKRLNTTGNVGYRNVNVTSEVLCPSCNGTGELPIAKCTYCDGTCYQFNTRGMKADKTFPHFDNSITAAEEADLAKAREILGHNF